MALRVQRYFSDIRNARGHPKDHWSTAFYKDPRDKRIDQPTRAFQRVLELRQESIHCTQSVVMTDQPTHV